MCVCTPNIKSIRLVNQSFLMKRPFFYKTVTLKDKSCMEEYHIFSVSVKRKKNVDIILQISIFPITFLSDRLWVNRAALLHCCNMYSVKNHTEILIKSEGDNNTQTTTYTKLAGSVAFINLYSCKLHLGNFCLFRQVSYLL